MSTYFANFDGSDFEKYSKTEFNRLGEDACYKQAKDAGNETLLKFYTTNHADLIKARENYNFFSIGAIDTNFVPSDRVDTYSTLLNGENGSTLTNCRVKNGFGMLPVNLPYKGQVSRGDPQIEDSLRFYQDPKKNACLQKDSEFHNRSFYLFDDSKGIETPNAMKSVENYQRAGQSTRFNNSFT